MPIDEHKNSPGDRKGGLRRKLSLVIGGVVLLLALAACQTATRTYVQLPNVPGATYIGSKECEQCHGQIYRDFQGADHARLIGLGENAVNAGCESCHGPASLHSQSGGEVKPPFSFGAGRAHSSSFDGHEAAGRGRGTENMCLQCHLDVRGEFNLPSHHPMPEGKVTCVDCHSPHKGSIHLGGGTSLLAENETCLKCHPNQRGPFAFEHAAMREGCTTCHKPHGSVNDKLLTVRDANACLKCHFQRVSGGVLMIGGSDHTARVRQGGCWTAGCHEAVHGSRVSPSLRF